MGTPHLLIYKVCTPGGYLYPRGPKYKCSYLYRVEVLLDEQGDELTPDEVQDRLDHFLVERLFSSQGNRLEDQRCPYVPLTPPPTHRTRVLTHSRSVDNLLVIIADSQLDRIEEQRAPLSNHKVRLEC